MFTSAPKAALLLALFAALGSAQNFGRISGTVSDSSSAVMPGVTVRVLNEGTGVERTATTNETGSYVVTNLPVGTYTVKVEPTGFQGELRTGLTLVADGRLTVDFGLKPGSATQSIDVVAASAEAV